MLNEIYLLDNRLIVKKEKVGKFTFYHIADGTIVKCKDHPLIQIKCIGCSRLYNKRPYYGRLEKIFECQHCNKAGERNPFYNKTHTEDNKKRHSNYMTGRFMGEKNAFFGKTHTDETKRIIAEKCSRSGEENGFYGKTHSLDTRRKLSESSRRYALQNPDKMREMGIKSSSKKYTKTEPERLFEDILVSLEIEYKYNKIIKNVGQFDFCVDNFLFEVHGDYWHANPLKYGEGKRPINERQKYKIQRDIEKKQLAEQLGYTIVYFWEYDIKTGREKIIEFFRRFRSGKSIT